MNYLNFYAFQRKAKRKRKTSYVCMPHTFFFFHCLIVPSDSLLNDCKDHFLSFPVRWVVGTFLPVTFETFLLFLGNKP